MTSSSGSGDKGGEAEPRRTDEFVRSLLEPVKTDAEYRRIVATAEEARRFYERYERSESRFVEIDYGPPKSSIASFAAAGVSAAALHLKIDVAVVEMMGAWVAERSCGHTLEVQGRFLAKRRPAALVVDDFVPLPSFCQSLAYETAGPDDRAARFGKARMRTISMDDWKPSQTQFYTDLGIFAEAGELPIDPYKVPIPFHSHYLRSHYQHGPSPGDYDRIYHLKWLYAPVSGRNILYSGVLPMQVDVPHAFAPIAAPTASGADPRASFVDPTSVEAETVVGDGEIDRSSASAAGGAPLNMDDVELIVDAGEGAERRYSVPWAEGLLLGRGDDCDVQLPYGEVSRQHARLRWSGAGMLLLEDLGSAAGTTVDGRCLRGEVLVIERPCCIELGPAKLSLRF